MSTCADFWRRGRFATTSAGEGGSEIVVSATELDGLSIVEVTALSSAEHPSIPRTSISRPPSPSNRRNHTNVLRNSMQGQCLLGLRLQTVSVGRLRTIV